MSKATARNRINLLQELPADTGKERRRHKRKERDRFEHTAQVTMHLQVSMNRTTRLLTEMQGMLATLYVRMASLEDVTLELETRIRELTLHVAPSLLNHRRRLEREWRRSSARTLRIEAHAAAGRENLGTPASRPRSLWERIRFAVVCFFLPHKARRRPPFA